MNMITEAFLKSIAVAPRVTEEQINETIVQETYFEKDLLTICVLTLANGFECVGTSACASKENYNKEVGQRLAHKDAFGKIWALLGYELRTKVQLANELPLARIPEMVPYVGTKAVHAKPMCRRDYCSFRGWDLPKDEDGSDEGMLIEYADGYISWSPKKQFEEAYTRMG